MKKLSITLALLFVCLFTFAVDLKLQWCPSVEANFSGYKVYYVATNKVVGWTPDVYVNSSNCPPVIATNGMNWVRNYSTNLLVGTNNSFTLSNVIVGKTYYIAVSAFDTSGLESEQSNEIEVTPTNQPPSRPQNFRLLEVR